MISANYFHDGYTQSGFIAEVPRMHGSLRSQYRPALVEERSRLGEMAARLRPHLYDRQVAAFTAEKLIEWDLTDASGRDVAITPEALLRLQPTLFVKLHRIVLGWIASDVDPTWPADEAGQAMNHETEAALTGRPVGDARLEHDKKN